MKQLLKQMSVYGVGGVLCKIVQFALLPLYTRVLSPANYGTLELVNILGYILAMIYGFMISSGYVRYFYETKEEHKQNSYLGTAFFFTLFISIFVCILLCVRAEEISLLLFKSASGALYVKLIAIGYAINAPKQLFYNVLMVLQRAKVYVAINVISLVITLVTTVWLVAYLKQGVAGVLWAQLIGFAAEFIILSVLVLRASIFQFSFHSAKQMLSYSIPLIPVQIAAFVLNLSDRFFIQHFKTLDDVGLYSLGFKFASIIPLFAITPLRGFTPYIFSLIKEPVKCKQTISNFCRYYLAGILIIALAISLFAKETIAIMSNGKFPSAWTVVYLLCISSVFYGLANVVSYTVEIVKKTWLSGIFWVVAAFTSVGMNILLIPKYGMFGAALSSAISYLVILICYFSVSAIVYPTPFQYLRYIAIVLGFSLLYYVSTFICLGMVETILIKVLLLLGSCGILIISGYFTKSDINKIKSSVFLYYGKLSSRS